MIFTQGKTFSYTGLQCTLLKKLANEKKISKFTCKSKIKLTVNEIFTAPAKCIKIVYVLMHMLFYGLILGNFFYINENLKLNKYNTIFCAVHSKNRHGVI